MFQVRSPLLAALFAHGSPAPCVPCALAVLSASVLPAPFGSSILARTATRRRLELASRFFRIDCPTRERLRCAFHAGERAVPNCARTHAHRTVAHAHSISKMTGKR